MIAFDTNVLTEILLGTESYVERALRIPASEQAVPIVVIDELVRGWLNKIRQAEAKKGGLTLERAYARFELTIRCVSKLHVLSYSQKAHELYEQWEKAKLKGGSHDLRIAAICKVSGATLATRNKRDFQAIPGLSLEIWD